jgi:hypothetical protein
VFVGILPLSICCSLLKNDVSASYFLATAQLGSLFINNITAFKTVSTPAGGVVYDFTTESLSLVRLFNPYSAAANAGSAFLRSASASALSI